MILVFKDWLIDQQDREDFVGDLARVVVMQAIDQKFARRQNDEHKNWAEIVSSMAQPGHIEAFNDAWQEFLVEKRVAKESLD